MSEGFESQSGPLGETQTVAPAEPAPGARMDTEGAVPTDFTGSASESNLGSQPSLLENFRSSIEDAVRRHPWRAAFVCTLVGIAFGSRTRMKAHLVRTEYVDPTLSRAEGAMLGATMALVTGCRMSWHRAKRNAHDALGTLKGYSKPLKKVVRRARREIRHTLHPGPLDFLR